MSPSPLLPRQEGGQLNSAGGRSHSFGASPSVLGPRDPNSRSNKSGGVLACRMPAGFILWAPQTTPPPPTPAQPL